MLTYRRQSADTVDLQHTEVPPEYRGKGMAGVLAQVREGGLG